MSYNKANGYDDISSNNEAEDNIYIVLFISVSYIIKEAVESDGNKLAIVLYEPNEVI